MVKKMKNRSRTELLASMLTTAIVRPATKTRIMYTSFYRMVSSKTTCLC
jgi:predicted transcriptional regulator